MKKRKGRVTRETGETRIEFSLTLEGNGIYRGGIRPRFLDHMLHLVARHGGLDLEVKAEGDLEVDDHHLVEDLGIVFGRALAQALGEKGGVRRYGSSLLPMDDVLVAVALDLGGRFYFASDYRPERDRVGDLSTEMANHFFRSLAVEGRMNLHFRLLEPGMNEHHRVEALFKGFARALREAIRIEAGHEAEIPSTKGVL